MCWPVREGETEVRAGAGSHPKGADWEPGLGCPREPVQSWDRTGAGEVSNWCPAVAAGASGGCPQGDGNVTGDPRNVSHAGEGSASRKRVEP